MAETENLRVTGGGGDSLRSYIRKPQKIAVTLPMLFWNAMSILEMGRGLAASTLRSTVAEELSL